MALCKSGCYESIAKLAYQLGSTKKRYYELEREAMVESNFMLKLTYIPLKVMQHKYALEKYRSLILILAAQGAAKLPDIKV